MLHGITREWINIIPIRNYDDSDIYFAGLELLTPQLSKKLVKRLYQLHQKNNQAALFSFLEELQKKNPKILNKAILSYLNKG
jgi:type VI protein secretion system component VasK